MDSLADARALLGEVLNLNERTGTLERSAAVFEAVGSLGDFVDQKRAS